MISAERWDFTPPKPERTSAGLRTTGHVVRRASTSAITNHQDTLADRPAAASPRSTVEGRSPRAIAKAETSHKARLAWLARPGSGSLRVADV